MRTGVGGYLGYRAAHSESDLRVADGLGLSTYFKTYFKIYFETYFKTYFKTYIRRCLSTYVRYTAPAAACRPGGI